MKQAINSYFGSAAFDKVLESPAVEHGETGRTVTLFKGHVKHVFFFADDRKITDDHAAVIIESYLRNPEHGSEYHLEST